ncbi:MAG: hypothetical protein JXK05_12590 [Campylobacterales bacterium]|nr:hypothetical protein [Campylobacterales bacterium]
MLIDVVNNAGYGNMMRKHIQDLLIYLFENEQNFGILCKIDYLRFEPELPRHISSEFRPMTLFFLAGYTFESAHIEQDELLFEAGFGPENIGSFVTVPLLSIMQIIIDETPIFINLAQPRLIRTASTPSESEEGIKNSMQALLSNPENQKFFKKK